MDEDMYGFNSALMSPENLMLPSDYYQTLLSSSSGFSESASITPQLQNVAGSGGGGGGEEEEDTTFSVIKARIASHPLYPRLLDAYIDCQKVGAPPEVTKFLEEIRREKELCKQDCASTSLGTDPELDEFMETYCDMLVKYKSDLTKPFDEATTFLNKIEMQLSNLCKVSSMRSLSDEGGAAASSDEDISGGEVEAQVEGQQQKNSTDPDLKAKLLHKFGSHISSLKLEFSKKKKKGKLPREAKQALFDWWNLHYKWPYPTEADKIALAEATGLDQKQINNWFINQRKRHWKPSENLQFGLENLSGQFFYG